MSKFSFSARSLKNLSGVHKDLVDIAFLALDFSSVDFVVTDGLRTPEEQAHLLATGKSRIKNSRHLTGHAIDVAAWVNGRVNWDWPNYVVLADAFKQAAYELGHELEWGGDWKTFKDGPHFQLSRETHP